MIQMMRLLDISFKRPSENLAFDEVLLDGAEGGQAGETLRFWESRTPFHIVGQVGDHLGEVTGLLDINNDLVHDVAIGEDSDDTPPIDDSQSANRS